jgi:hypothetical protein
VNIYINDSHAPGELLGSSTFERTFLDFAHRWGVDLVIADGPT